MERTTACRKAGESEHKLSGRIIPSALIWKKMRSIFDKSTGDNVKGATEPPADLLAKNSLANQYAGGKFKTPTTKKAAGVLNLRSTDLLSHALTSTLPSALRGLTTVFGMGTGVTPSVRVLQIQSLTCIQFVLANASKLQGPRKGIEENFDASYEQGLIISTTNTSNRLFNLEGKTTIIQRKKQFKS